MNHEPISATDGMKVTNYVQLSDKYSYRYLIDKATKMNVVLLCSSGYLVDKMRFNCYKVTEKQVAFRDDI